ncbi:hypothetical protein FRB93_002510 [Tulasnella sp. JGI-2019a]|nr:hypothetical protein FRB93_002510 [Tulasnella sp. JGI-2019a]
MVVKPPLPCKAPKRRSSTMYSSTSTLASQSPVQPILTVEVQEMKKSLFDPTDVLAHCHEIFSVLKDIAGGSNLTPLKALSSVICFVIETAQNIRSLAQQSRDLAAKVARFSLAIAQSLSERNFTQEMAIRIGKLAMSYTEP